MIALLPAIGFPALAAEPSAHAQLYFDPDAIGEVTSAFNPQVGLPPVRDYVSSKGWSFNVSKPADNFAAAAKPAESRPSWTFQDGGDSFGRISLNVGTFGLETERRFNADKSIPTSQMFDSTLEKHSKKPFIGLSIEAPYQTDER